MSLVDVYPSQRQSKCLEACWVLVVCLSFLDALNGVSNHRTLPLRQTLPFLQTSPFRQTSPFPMSISMQWPDVSEFPTSYNAQRRVHMLSDDIDYRVFIILFVMCLR